MADAQSSSYIDEQKENSVDTVLDENDNRKMNNQNSKENVEVKQIDELHIKITEKSKTATESSPDLLLSCKNNHGKFHDSVANHGKFRNSVATSNSSNEAMTQISENKVESVRAEKNINLDENPKIMTLADVEIEQPSGKAYPLDIAGVETKKECCVFENNGVLQIKKVVSEGNGVNSNEYNLTTAVSNSASLCPLPLINEIDTLTVNKTVGDKGNVVTDDEDDTRIVDEELAAIFANGTANDCSVDSHGNTSNSNNKHCAICCHHYPPTDLRPCMIDRSTLFSPAHCFHHEEMVGMCADGGIATPVQHGCSVYAVRPGYVSEHCIAQRTSERYTCRSINSPTVQRPALCASHNLTISASDVRSHTTKNTVSTGPPQLMRSNQHHSTNLQKNNSIPASPSGFVFARDSQYYMSSSPCWTDRSSNSPQLGRSWSQTSVSPYLTTSLLPGQGERLMAFEKFEHYLKVSHLYKEYSVERYLLYFCYFFFYIVVLRCTVVLLFFLQVLVTIVT